MSSFAESVEREVVEAPEQAEPEAPQETPEVEAAPEAEPEPQPEPVSPEILQKRLDGLESAVSEHRKKAQDLERQLEYYRGRSDAKPVPHQPPPPLATEEDFWSNPVETMAKVAHQVSLQHVSNVEKARIDRADARMAKKHEDYSQIRDQFMATARVRPGLVEEMLMADNPAEYVYEWGKAQQQAGDVGALQKRIAELEAQVAGKKPAPPKTQAGARSSGAATAGGSDPDPFAKSY